MQVFVTSTNVNMLILETGPKQTAARIVAISKNPLLTPIAEAILATHGQPGEDEIARQLALTTRVMHHHPNPIKVQRQIIYLALAGHTEESVSLMRQSGGCPTQDPLRTSPARYGKPPMRESGRWLPKPTTSS